MEFKQEHKRNEWHTWAKSCSRALKSRGGSSTQSPFSATQNVPCVCASTACTWALVSIGKKPCTLPCQRPAHTLPGMALHQAEEHGPGSKAALCRTGSQYAHYIMKPLGPLSTSRARPKDRKLIKYLSHTGHDYPSNLQLGQRNGIPEDRFQLPGRRRHRLWLQSTQRVKHPSSSERPS